MTAATCIRVLLADERRLVAAAMQAAICREPDLNVVSHAADHHQLVAQLVRWRPDVAILDADLPLFGAAHSCASIKADGADTRVLIVSDRPDRELLVAAVEAGADGYLDRTVPVPDLMAAIRQVHAGGAWIPQCMLGALLRRLIQRRREEDSVVDRFSSLSRREKEVLALLAEGLDNQAIAASLVLSPHTARTHVQNVLDKLQVHSRVEAANLANRHRLVERFSRQS